MLNSMQIEHTSFIHTKKDEFKIKKTIFIIFIIWIVAMGGALNDFNSHSLRLNSVQSFILPICLLVFVIVAKFNARDVKKYLASICVLMIWQLILVYKYGSYDFLIGRLYDLTFAFILVRALGIKKMFYYYEVAVSKLALLSLIVWFPIVVFPQLKTYLIPLSLPINETGTIVASWGVVGISNSENLGIIRNLGFAWEPGRFSSFVSLALLLHLFRTRFRLFEKNFWPLLLALLSSLATTGYMAFAICAIGYFFNAKNTAKDKILKYIILIGFILFFTFSPFMLDKIQNISNTDTFLTDGAANYYGKIGKNYVPQRSEGLYLEFLNIIHDPLFGYGDNSYYSYVQKYLFPQLKINLSNGILQIISMLGIPLACIFYILLYKSSCYISKLYEIKGRFLVFLMISAINVSYNFYFEPFIISIVLYSLFRPKSDKIIKSKQ